MFKSKKSKIDYSKIIGSSTKKKQENDLEERLKIKPTQQEIPRETSSEPQTESPSTRAVEEKLKIVEQKLAELERKTHFARAAEAEAPIKEIDIVRVPTGISGLDELIDGGFEKGSTILVTGAAGTGKTTFALQFLYYGAKQYNEPGIFISFEENKASIYRHHLEFGWDFEQLEKNNMFRVIEYKPHQVNKLMEEGGGPIKDTIKSISAKRLAIDSITAYSLLFRDEYKKRESILDFFELLKKWGCTSIIISEMPPKIAEVKEGGVGFLTDAVISLYYSKKEAEKGVRVHSMEILKMRGTKHTNRICALTFEKKGIVIYPDIEVF